MDPLPSDATLRYIVNSGRLNKPSDWICALLKNLHALPKVRGPYCVRIGLSGTGHSPNYRIEPISEPEKTPEDDIASPFNIPETPHWAYRVALNTAYNGRGHKKLMSGLNQENWSSETNSEQEINELLLRCWNAPQN